MAVSKSNTRTMFTLSLDLKEELGLKAERDNDNLNTVLLKAVYAYLKKDVNVDKEVLKDVKYKLDSLEYSKIKKQQQE